MTTAEPQAVIERPERARFELPFEGGVAFASYRQEGELLVVTHTEVPAAFNGRGIGSRLARGIFETARATGRRVVPACSFIADWAARHPDFNDVLGRR